MRTNADLDALADRELNRLELAHKVRIEIGLSSTAELSCGKRKRLALLTACLEERPVFDFDEWAAGQGPRFRDFFDARLLPELKDYCRGERSTRRGRRMTRSNATSTDRWLPTALPWSRAALRLFCFPYAGGGASVFRDWIGALGESVEVCPVQLPGRETRFCEPAFTRFAPLVTALVESLGPHLDRPFALFGHSLGALVAFEFARRLRRDGRPGPVHLFVSGCGAPQVARAGSTSWIHRLPDAAFRHELRRLGGTPAEVLDNDELMDVLLPTLRADFALCDTYVYTDGGPLSCPISALGGWDDGAVAHDDLDAWCAQTTARFRLDMLPGDHFFLRSAQPLLLAQVGRVLSNRTACQQTGQTA